MRDCNQYAELISCMTDGELSGEELKELNAHLEACPDCRLIYDAFSGISENFPEPVDAPEALARGIMYKIGLEGSGRGKRRFSFGRFTAIAACLAVIIFSVARYGPLLSSGNSGAAEDAARSYASTNTNDNAEPADGSTAGTGDADSGEADAELSMIPQETADEETEGGDGSVEEFYPMGDDSGYAEDGIIIPSLSVEEGFVLTGMTRAQIYQQTDEQPPILTVTDAETLDTLSKTLGFSEYENAPGSGVSPAYIVRVEGEEPAPFDVLIWVIDGKLICGIGETVYIASGTLDDLKSLINAG